MIESAGIVAYRRRGEQIEVLLVHPSGNYNRKAPWGIPKGNPDEGEGLEAAAVRETKEETGIEVQGDLVPLGSVEYKRSRKRIHAFAALAPTDARPQCASWEVDRVEFLPVDEALTVIHPDQRLLIARLMEMLERGQIPLPPA
jgi:predicted NUDIX family NTP pyrophosphohydrolase